MIKTFSISLILAGILSADIIGGKSFSVPVDQTTPTYALYEFSKNKSYNDQVVDQFLEFVPKIQNYSLYKDTAMVNYLKYLYSQNSSEKEHKKIMNLLMNPDFSKFEESTTSSKLKESRKFEQKSLDDFYARAKKQREDQKILADKILSEFMAKPLSGKMSFAQMQKEKDKILKTNEEKKVSLEVKLKKDEADLLKKIADNQDRIKKQGAEALDKEKDFYETKVLNSDTYNDVLFLYSLGNKKEAENLLASLQKNRKEPSNLLDSVSLMRYYILTGSQDKALALFNNFSQARYRNIADTVKNNRMNDIEPLLFHFYTYGAYLNRMDPTKFNLYKDYAEKLSNGNTPFIYYILYTLEDTNENYAEASKYLDFVNEKDPFDGIKEKIFDIENKAAIKYYSESNWQMSWLHAKKGIENGYKLDYDRYYTNVVNLKKILKVASDKYTADLVKSGQKDLAFKIASETSKVLNLKQ